MPQEIRVLQCSSISCNCYQVDIVKKANKWQCKICGLKQSVFKEIFRGNGAECRAKVQQLNLERGKRQQERDMNDIDLLVELEKGMDDIKELVPENIGTQKNGKQSKWSKYVDENIFASNSKESPLENSYNNVQSRQQQSLNKCSFPPSTPSDPQFGAKSNSKWQNYL
ncbi:MRN complex-interacting protein [Scaptodrosophila lebanonensis]|uniref:MRN complex-interacting protein n=1 Tax=Drosophila lebanonensis TaxID=7225 RepID=A0A6J2T756_DROLE|nr:MRN complex-interacting protein [Scaptodrosophila lebanonensis]